MRVTPLGLCLMVIVNSKPLNLEKTTSSVLSVLLLIYDWKKQKMKVLITQIFKIHLKYNIVEALL